MIGGKAIRTFTIITTEANADIGIHDRMPVILERETWPLWLGDQEGDPSELLHPSPDGTLGRWRVSPDVNSPRHDHAGLLDEVEAVRPKDDWEAAPNSA